ncbi:MAG TPA: phosphatase PAP2 family protein, partial [Candidatus Goldiibacteriota bacterium]|nr:phosphatase PAP2 family protein [Candidatus Goldiibacteriota bacterium]
HLADDAVRVVLGVVDIERPGGFGLAAALVESADRLDHAQGHALQPGTPGRGHSFPCGHASMGFLFMSLYFVLKNKNRPAAYAALFGGAAYGTLMGLARMAQGGHYLSDVMWAGGITFIAAETAYHMILGGDSGRPVFGAIAKSAANKPAAAAVTAILLGLLIFIFLFSTPFNSNREYRLSAVNGEFLLEMECEADVLISGPEKGHGSVGFEASGFGFPKRRYDADVKAETGANSVKYVYKTVKKGFFSELNASIKVLLPEASEYRITVRNRKGNIVFNAKGRHGFLALTTLNGAIKYESPGETADLYMSSPKGSVYASFREETEFSGSAFLDIKAGRELMLAAENAFFVEMKGRAEKVNGSKEIYFASLKGKGPKMKASAGRGIYIINEKAGGDHE